MYAIPIQSYLIITCYTKCRRLAHV